MSKIEVVGPRPLLMEALVLLRDQGLFQVEPDIRELAEEADEAEEARIRSLLLDERALSERLFCQELLSRIEELVALLPPVQASGGAVEALPAIQAVAGLLPKHIETCRTLAQRREALEREEAGLARYDELLGAFNALLATMAREPGLDLVGVTLQEPGREEHLRQIAAHLTEGRFEMTTTAMEDGTQVALIATEEGLAERLRKTLAAERLPELPFPDLVARLPFPEKLAALRRRSEELSAAQAALAREQAVFAGRWLPLYLRVRAGLKERLALLRETASVFQTGLCFFILGWMPAEKVEALRRALEERFAGQVVLEERELREEDLERVPVELRNPRYFRPFELFSRMLPLPRYTSFDPTPFLGIFFPLFFGMMLGDAGYGALLLLATFLLLWTCRERPLVADAARILGVCALCSIFFGLLFGELFGEAGAAALGLHPLLVERSRAILPMLLFALSVGVVHVVLGLFLGFLTSLRTQRREALFKLLSLLVILLVTALCIATLTPVPWVTARPVVGVTLLVVLPLLFLTRGLMAPLELLKSIGHIISYVRLMAIGLASVLLAHVANRLGGMTGDVVAGILVAGLLHAFNLVLGVFAPTVHALRLHYVEFFSKFFEPGGRKFRPIRKGRK